VGWSMAMGSEASTNGVERGNKKVQESTGNSSEKPGEGYPGFLRIHWNDNWLNIVRDRKDKNVHLNSTSVEPWRHETFEKRVREKRKKGRPYKIARLLALVECIRNFDLNSDVQRPCPRARQEICIEFRKIWTNRYKYYDKKLGWLPIKRGSEKG
jgi:hypothetical protein